MQVAVLLAFLLCNASLAMAASIIDVVDDVGHRISLSVPASRIISLAPNITELLYAAGAGAAIVGVSAWSDYPPAAEKLPSSAAAMKVRSWSIDIASSMCDPVLSVWRPILHDRVRLVLQSGALLSARKAWLALGYWLT